MTLQKNKHNQQQILQQSLQSNLIKDSILSPVIKDERISGNMMNSQQFCGSMPIRGSLGNSQHQFFIFAQNQNSETYGKVKKNEMNIIQEIQEDELGERMNTQANNQQRACNSTTKNKNNQFFDQTKKDVYVSFGNSKDASLQNAIQQVNNSYLNQQSQFFSQIDQRQVIQVYNANFPQMKPFPNIIEYNNINDQEKKSQQNTPELKQITDEAPSMQTSSSIYSTNLVAKTNNDQQKPFRNLFGGVQKSNQSFNQIDNNNNSVPSAVQVNKNSSLISLDNKMIEDIQNDNNQIDKSPNQRNSSLPNEKNLKNSQTNINSNNSLSAKNKQAQLENTKSPKYSMVEYDDNQNFHQIPMSKNMNQLDDYVQMIEKWNMKSNCNNEEKQINSNKENEQINCNNSQQLLNDNSYNYQSKNYFSIHKNSSSRQSMQKNNHQENKMLNHNNNNNANQIDDEVIAIHDKQEDFDHPLFSSPGYKS